jgi:hypothetical protein
MIGVQTVTANLESGGGITLMVPTNTVDMSRADREFVFEMVDKVKAYGTRPELTSGSPSDGADP